MVIAIIFVVLAIVVAVFLAFVIVGAEIIEKKRAYKLLSFASPNAKALKRTAKRLSGYRDEEARELVRRLMAKVT